MDKGHAARGVNDPEFIEAVVGVELRLKTAVIGEACRRDFNGEQNILPFTSSSLRPFG